jgi:hypothetical protein
MTTNKRTVSVRLDSDAARRLEKAARLAKQSRGAFLEKAGDATARRVLLDWAVDRYRQGTHSLSQLAEETGLAVEEIMEALGAENRDVALEMFLASSATVAETTQNPEFLRLAREAVEAVRAETPRTTSSR